MRLPGPLRSQGKGADLMDISDVVRARRLCRYASWATYLGASWYGLAFLAAPASHPPEAAWSAALAVALPPLGCSIRRGSRVGAVAQAVLVAGYATSVNQPFQALWTWDVGPGLALGAVLAVAGAVAAVASSRARKRFVPAPSPGFSRWLRHRAAGLRSKHVWMAAAHVCAIGVLLPALVVAFFALGGAINSGRWTWFGKLSAYALFLLLILASSAGMAYAWRTAKRYAALQAAEMRRRDTRPPVILLRSFGDDVIGVDRGPTVNTPLSFWDSKALTLEEVIERALWRAGPVIAIGRPGEKLPPAGAAREYVPDGEWQARVGQLIAECRYVSVVAGTSEGLLWECRMLSEAGALAKVVVVFPPDHGQLEVAWRTMSAAFSLRESVLPPRVLAARLHDAGAPWFVTSRWNDEDAYGLAIECSLQPTP